MEHNPTTISDLEHDLEKALDHVRTLDASGQLPPELRPLLLLAPVDGTSVHVSLRHRDMARQIRRNHGAQAFSQSDCAVWIVFEAPLPDAARDGGRGDARGDRRDDASDSRADRGVPHERAPQGARPFDEFVLALNDAENQPQLTFVSLKWFRDTFLVKSGYRWAQDIEMPRRLLQEATERNIILTSRVPNPKQPEFPVTSIRLNREHPDVKRILEHATSHG